MSDAGDWVAIQRRFWSDSEVPELAQVAELEGAELARVHRAATMRLFREQGVAADPLDPVDASGPVAEICRATTRRMTEAGSPWRPRQAAVWQTDTGDEPALRGVLANASVTHLGGFELIELDAENRPIMAWLIPFAEIVAIQFQGQALYRPCRVELGDGRAIVAAAALLYATSFETREPTDRDGSMTRFACHLDVDSVPSGAAIGIGHQDFFCAETLFGLGSVREIRFGV